MSRVNFSVLLDIFTRYLCFGLALYAGCALAAVVWLRRGRRLAAKPVVGELLRAYGCILLLVMLQTIQEIWGRIYPGRFPPQILRVALPILYFAVGNALFRVAREEIREDDAPRNKIPTAEAKSARPGS